MIRTHDGKTYTFAPLTIGDLRTLERRAASDTPPLKRAEAAHAIGASQALIDRLAEEDAAELTAGCQYGTARMHRWLGSAAGVVEVLTASLRRGSPDYTDEARTRAVEAIPFPEAFRLVGQVIRDTLPEASDSDPPTPPTT